MLPRYDEAEGKVYVVGGKGDTWRNGKPVREGIEVCLDIYDRVAMGDQVTIYGLYDTPYDIPYDVPYDTPMIHPLSGHL